MKAMKYILLIILAAIAADFAMSQSVREVWSREECLTDPFNSNYEWDNIGRMRLSDSAAIINEYRKRLDGLKNILNNDSVSFRFRRQWPTEFLERLPDSATYIYTNTYLATLQDISCYSGLPLETFYMVEGYAGYRGTRESEIRALIAWFEDNYQDIRVNELVSCVTDHERAYGLMRYFSELIRYNSDNEEMCKVWQDSIDSIKGSFVGTIPGFKLTPLDF